MPKKIKLRGKSKRRINKRPAMLQENDVLKAVNFEESWIEHVTEKGESCI